MLALWVASLVASAGAALTIMGALSDSVLMAVLGIALAVSPLLVWVIWTLALMLFRPGGKAV